MVALLKKTKILALDRIKATWPVLRLVCMYPRAFPNITGLRLEFPEDNFDIFMAIPDELLAQITELGLNEVTYNEDPEKFITMARHLIQRTRKLKYLRISPVNQQNSWIKLLAECEPVLSELETLIIGA